VRRIKVHVKGALGYPPIALAEAGPSTSSAHRGLNDGLAAHNNDIENQTSRFNA